MHINATIKKSFVLVITSFVISACGEQAYDSGPLIHPKAREDPRLYAFHVHDTYGTDSRHDKITHLALSPYINSGYFDVSWDVESDYDYYLELRFNTRPSTDGSRLISSTLCDDSDNCYWQDYQQCRYTSDYHLVCDTPNLLTQSEYIGDFIESSPQDAYLILQVCDTSFVYCEYESQHVSME